MFDLKYAQKGGERLDVADLNANIFRLLSEANVKPIFIDGGYRAFTETIRTIVTQPESFKIAFLFVNRLSVWNDTASYPPIPNVDDVEITDTTGTTITTTIDVNLTGNCKIVETNSRLATYVSWRYCEFDLGDDYLYMVLNRFRYSSGDAENGLFDFAYRSNIQCDVYQIPIRDLTSIYIPFFYNNVSSCDFANVVDEYIYERHTGVCSATVWNAIMDSASPEPFSFWSSAGDKPIFTNSGETIDVWFFTNGKIDVSYLVGDYRHYEIFSYNAYKLVHLVLEDVNVPMLSTLINDVDWIEGLCIFWKTTGKVYYPDIVTEPRNYVCYAPVIKTGIDKPIDMFQVNYIKYLVGCRYNEDWANYVVMVKNNYIRLESRTYAIQGIAKTELDGYINNDRGAFLIS